MNCGDKEESVLGVEASLADRQGGEVLCQPGANGFGQLADAVSTKTAAQMAEALLADDKLLRALLGS